MILCANTKDISNIYYNYTENGGTNTSATSVIYACMRIYAYVYTRICPYKYITIWLYPYTTKGLGD